MFLFYFFFNPHRHRVVSSLTMAKRFDLMRGVDNIPQLKIESVLHSHSSNFLTMKKSFFDQ